MKSRKDWWVFYQLRRLLYLINFLATTDSFELEQLLRVDDQQVIDSILNRSSKNQQSTNTTTDGKWCPETQGTSLHRWMCPYLEDPYWICELCGEQTETPVMTLSPTRLAPPIVPEWTVGASQSLTAPSNGSTAFRIQRNAGARTRKISVSTARRAPKLGLPRSIVRSKSARTERINQLRKSLEKKQEVPSSHTTSSSTKPAPAPARVKSTDVEYTDRKYLSKKKQQAMLVLQAYRGQCPVSTDIARVRRAWHELGLVEQLPAEWNTRSATSMLQVIKELGLKRNASDLGYFMVHVADYSVPNIDESALFVDFDRLLRAYLKTETQQLSSGGSHKRRALDCSYLLYQLLKQQQFPVLPEQVVCRDRVYHDDVYSRLARELTLSFVPLEHDSGARQL